MPARVSAAWQATHAPLLRLLRVLGLIGIGVRSALRLLLLRALVFGLLLLADLGRSAQQSRLPAGKVEDFRTGNYRPTRTFTTLPSRQVYKLFSAIYLFPCFAIKDARVR